MPKTKKQIKKEFQEEIKKPSPVDFKELFYGALKKDPEDLDKAEIRALFYRMAYLSDEERFKFRNILVRENLIEEEEERFRKLFPNQKFEKYFPLKDKVEEHYEKNFLAGRTK